MAYSNHTRKQALSEVQVRINAGAKVRHSLHSVSKKRGIPYPTLRRWYYEIKDRPVTNPAMAELGACWNLQEAMKGRRGALDRVVRVYMKLTGSKDDIETVEHHYRREILARMIKMGNEIRAKHLEFGNQRDAIAEVAREYDFPANILTRWYRMVKKEVKPMEKKMVVIKGFPVELDRRAKAQAALEGITFKALVIKCLEEYLQKKGKVK